MRSDYKPWVFINFVFSLCMSWFALLFILIFIIMLLYMNLLNLQRDLNYQSIPTYCLIPQNLNLCIKLLICLYFCSFFNIIITSYYNYNIIIIPIVISGHVYYKYTYVHIYQYNIYHNIIANTQYCTTRNFVYMTLTLYVGDDLYTRQCFLSQPFLWCIMKYCLN